MRVEGEASLVNIPLSMHRPHLLNIPNYTVPSPYRIRPFRSGDEEHWAAIEWKAGEFPSQDEARLHYANEFGEHSDEMELRCFLLEDGAGSALGTTTAWYKSLQGKIYGRIHWVAIVPEHQGRGLAKPLLASAMKRLADFHDKAYLTTQTTSWKAIGMYLQFGFEPWIVRPSCKDGWAWMEEQLQRKI
ncbi:GNAT family N-acetyltransferase [Paenibacillus sp. J2TS4]|uniref:GNAT family N-acetyltransferase n=1 Tax=Paenibacillus sp. J2TS4 TaxID=2807194 RepID=UPI001B227748|nr:GNAT family N-acetyltransferase [Paenibacillus sp. J2TS4]GIP35046.1 hypothetical protein J2TS4_42560 [Paenibacillus sp. J2TS4]